jgi:hypothetical protein
MRPNCPSARGMKQVALTLALVLVACRDEQPLEPHPPGSAGLASASLVGPSTPNASITWLGDGDGAFLQGAARSINASGAIVGDCCPGGAGYGAGIPLGLIFVPGPLRPTPSFSSPSVGDLLTSAPVSINDAGLITAHVPCQPVIASLDGAASALLLFADGGCAGAEDINNFGDIVGEQRRGVPRVGTLPDFHPILWHRGASGYEPEDLGLLNGIGYEAHAIAPGLIGDETIVVGGSVGGPEAFIWRRAQGMMGLPRRGSLTGPAEWADATDVADNGVVVGFDDDHAVVWQEGQAIDLHPPCQALFTDRGGGSRARAIALIPSVPPRTLIVGQCIGVPAVWYDDGFGGYTAELLPLLDGDTEGETFDVNASGRIVGYTRPSPFVAPRQEHAVLWTFTLPPLGNQPPTASAGGSYSGLEGAAISFDGSASTDADGQTLTFDWDFGDGSAHGSGATPVHVYADNGTYTITLTVDDGHGGSDVATTTATIGNVVPQVNAGTASSLQSGQTLNFSGDVTDAGSADTPSSWTLDWGDGTAPLSGNSAIPGSVSATHPYYGTGTFTLQLTVTDKDGGVGTGSRTVTVDPRSVTVGASPDAVSLSERRSKEIDIIIFSASGLDATQIDPATLTVGDGNDPDALPVQRKNGAYVLSMRDVNRDGLRELTFSVEKVNPDLGLAAPGTTLVVRGSIPTSLGPIVLRGSVAIAVAP